MVDGFFVDAYFPESNVAVEVDEPFHYHNGQLSQKDIARQKTITEHLGCDFMRVRC